MQSCARSAPTKPCVLEATSYTHQCKLCRIQNGYDMLRYTKNLSHSLMFIDLHRITSIISYLQVWCLVVFSKERKPSSNFTSVASFIFLQWMRKISSLQIPGCEQQKHARCRHKFLRRVLDIFDHHSVMRSLSPAQQPAIVVWDTDVKLPVEAPKASKCGINGIRPVCSGNNHHLH